MGGTPTIVRNPSSDDEFQTAIDDMLASGIRDPAAAEEWLREQYPRVVVRPRELAGETGATWYVYREGRWIANK